MINLEWWNLYNDPMLDTLIYMALEHNRDVLIAMSRMEQAYAILGMSKADLWPSLGYDVSASYAQPDAAGGGADPGALFAITPSVYWELDFWGKVKDITSHAILPLACYLVGSFAVTTLLMKNNLMDNLAADYVRTAVAKGVSFKDAVVKHALRNSLIPVVTFLAIDLGALMGGAIITETIFNLPGIGRAVFEGVQRQEGTVVVGIATFMIVVYMVANLVADILYGILDPRIRYD